MRPTDVKRQTPTSDQLPDDVGFDVSPEDMQQRAHQLTTAGERLEAANLLRFSVSLAESQNADATRLIPLVESLAEVLWQMDEKREARLQANRALKLWFSTRPDAAWRDWC